MKSKIEELKKTLKKLTDPDLEKVRGGTAKSVGQIINEITNDKGTIRETGNTDYAGQ
jgi:hypothetical protein